MIDNAIINLALCVLRLHSLSRYINHYFIVKISNIWSNQVLDMQAYEARQREYAANGHKHFYFMTLNGSEVCNILHNIL